MNENGGDKGLSKYENTDVSVRSKSDSKNTRRKKVGEKRMKETKIPDVADSSSCPVVRKLNFTPGAVSDSGRNGDDADDGSDCMKKSKTMVLPPEVMSFMTQTKLINQFRMKLKHELSCNDLAEQAASSGFMIDDNVLARYLIMSNGYISSISSSSSSSSITIASMNHHHDQEHYSQSISVTNHPANATSSDMIDSHYKEGKKGERGNNKEKQVNTTRGDMHDKDTMALIKKEELL